jgi:hypothetical protein
VSDKIENGAGIPQRCDRPKSAPSPAFRHLAHLPSFRDNPIVPIISILLSALLTIDLAWLAPATSGIGILIVLTGVPAYFLWRLRGAQHANPV